MFTVQPNKNSFYSFQNNWNSIIVGFETDFIY